MDAFQRRRDHDAATPTLYTLLAYSVLPDEVPPEGVNLTEFYASQHKVWAVLYAAAALLDLARSLEAIVLEGGWPGREEAIPAGLTLVMLGGPAIMYFARAQRAQWVGVLWLVPFVALAILDLSIEI